LEAALQEARAANARLPVARADVLSSQAQAREARAQRWPTLSAEGDLRYAAPDSAFPDNGSEERLELFVRGPIYSGGALRAGIAVAEANVAGSAARFRVAEADLELEVRVRFSEVLAAQAEVSVQQGGVERLRRYLQTVRLRQIAGQGLEADLLKTQAQLATQQIAAADAELRLGEARYELNDLLGREPPAPLALAPLPAPTAPAETGDQEPWLAVPDLESAAADVAAADESVAIARAQRKPHLSFEVGGGFLGTADPRFPGDPLGQRVLRGFGFALMLSYDWTLFDFGAYRARLALAQLSLQKARDSRLVAYRGARLEWDRARLQLAGLYRQLQLFDEAVPRSTDAYLAAESLYRGGAGSALAVLDAFRAWVDAAVAASKALLAYRTAEARYLRWGGP
jgi:outer membrane protein TolC